MRLFASLPLIHYAVSYEPTPMPPPALHELEAEVMDAVWDLGEASVRAGRWTR